MISLSLCMIVKNEEAVLERILKPVSQVMDAILIADTGSSDRTKEIAEQYTSQVFDFPWCDDFSAPRNFLLEKVSTDYWMWLDADDVLDEENLERLKSLKETLDPGTDVVMMEYAAGFDQSGRTTFSYFRERIMKTSRNFRWNGAVHETMIPEGNIIYSDMTLGGIWEKFNIDRPADFKGHSLSVSDIVVLHQNGENTAHYVDSIGFQQVPEFLQEQAQQTPVFDKLSPEQQQALSDTVKDTLQLLVDADKRIYGDVTGKTLEAIAAQGYSYKGGQLEKQQPEATPESLMTGETVRTPRGNFYITDMSREQIEAAGFGFHHASEDGKYLIMGNGTQAYAIAAEQPQRDNPLKHVEDIVEQNDNNFDGIINNTPQTPTVADLEQRAKAGEAISVTDLAKAVKAEKREQPQKKPSILKKLDEYKKQAAQQPKDKQKEQKKDLEV